MAIPEETGTEILVVDTEAAEEMEATVMETVGAVETEVGIFLMIKIYLKLTVAHLSL